MANIGWPALHLFLVGVIEAACASQFMHVILEFGRNYGRGFIYVYYSFYE